MEHLVRSRGQSHLYRGISRWHLALRAPYLHNGSVPTLYDLLEPVDSRPKLFYRGYNLYDPVKVAFVSEGTEAKRVGTKYDVSQKGNSTQGHALGTTLPAGRGNGGCS